MERETYKKLEGRNQEISRNATCLSKSNAEKNKEISSLTEKLAEVGKATRTLKNTIERLTEENISQS